MAKKGVAQKVRMDSTGTKQDGRPTGTRKYARKGKNQEGKMRRRCYDPAAWNPETGKNGMHVEYVEGKMPSSKKQ